MYLRDLAVEASHLAELPLGRTRAEFNQSTHAAVEAYLAALPRRKVVLDDLAKVNVVLGQRPANQRAYFAALNVAIVFWPRFNFARYFSLSRAAQQRRIVEILHKTLLRIARRRGDSAHLLTLAHQSICNGPFPLPEISEAELNRRWGLATGKTKRRKSARKS